MFDNLETTAVLQSYIQDGKVNYEKLRDDGLIKKYMEKFRSINPEILDRDEQLAYWLNVYNFLVLETVLSKLDNNPHWEGVTSLWRKFKFFVWNRYEIGGRKVSLYSLENKILRKEFDDPRIHFALNCASTSCPYLPDGVFTGKNLEVFLETLTGDFINNQDGVIVKGKMLHLSEIFKMYSKDFGGEEGIIKFVRDYYEGDDFPEGPDISYQDYDWSINALST